jgi:hypothetical protein
VVTIVPEEFGGRVFEFSSRELFQHMAAALKPIYQAGHGQLRHRSAGQ